MVEVAETCTDCGKTPVWPCTLCESGRCEECEEFYD